MHEETSVSLLGPSFPQPPSPHLCPVFSPFANPENGSHFWALRVNVACLSLVLDAAQLTNLRPLI